MTGVVALYMGLIYFYYALKIVIRSPQHLKSYAYSNIVGVTMFSFVVTGLYLTGLTSIFPGSANFVSAVGGIISIMAFTQSPTMIYVLPFTTYRLIVISSNSGTTLYTYDWFESYKPLISSDLFSTAFTGLNSFTNEAINMGDIKEIILDNAVMEIVSLSDQGLRFVVLSSNTSRVLKQNLHTFAIRFSKQYNPHSKSTLFNPIETTKFRDAERIVENSFPYIPKYSTPR